MKKTLIILNHPNLNNSRANKTLIHEIQKLENVTIRHLDSVYGTDIKAFDVQLEQKLLLEHDRIIFQFPFYWYGSPALLKAYQDEVLTYGFAYGSKGNKLHGKEFKIVTTTGGPSQTYKPSGRNLRTVEELLVPFHSTANLTGMIYSKPLVFHGVMGMNNRELQKNALLYRGELLRNQWEMTTTQSLSETAL